MRVICINDEPGFCNKSVRPTFSVGEILVIVDDDGDNYKLDGHDRYWCHSRFIPLSDLCETEFERNYNKELV